MGIHDRIHSFKKGAERSGLYLIKRFYTKYLKM
jgi:hypothetical protein